MGPRKLQGYYTHPGALMWWGSFMTPPRGDLTPYYSDGARMAHAMWVTHGVSPPEVYGMCCGVVW